MFPHLPKIRQKVESLFYNYGLFCATHQLSTMVFAIASVLFICYPLTKLSFLGNAASSFETPLRGYTVPETMSHSTSVPHWYSKAPLGYVQQILVKSTVAPQVKNRKFRSAALRACLHQVFGIIREVNDFKYQNGSSVTTTADVCLRVAEPTTDKPLVLPQFDCFILSPANLWKNKEQVFLRDLKMEQTIYKSDKSFYKAKEILFGTPWLETGMSKWQRSNQPTTLQYAVTVIYKTYDGDFIDSLSRKLMERYPLSEVNVPSSKVVSHVSYQQSNLADYTPLIAAYMILFLYIYFSVQKIEMVKSKWGLALAAVVTVVMSLFMSISICASFGVPPSVSSGEIFPYLVVIIGLENVLVLTRSVVSTAHTLEVKMRIAEGLRKEGWKITKHLVTELLILAISFFTFVPVIQEFCLFALIGLVVDFYLQMVFFTTVLSIDIRRLELIDAIERDTFRRVQEAQHGDIASPKTTRGNHSGLSDDIYLVASFFNMPKRLKVMNFLAQHRVVQRLMMFCTVVWIVDIMYNYNILSTIAALCPFFQKVTKPVYFNFNINDTKYSGDVRQLLNNQTLQPLVADILHQDSSEVDNWKRTSFISWPDIFSLYKINVTDTYISFLPSIKLSILVSLEEAVRLHTGEEDRNIAPDGDYFDQSDPLKATSQEFSSIYGRFYMLTNTEKFMFGTGALLVLLAFGWLMRLLYSVMCGRNYDKWRTRGHHKVKQNKYMPFMREANTIYMSGHKQPIECIVTESPLVVSSCLAGEIRVWDGMSGEEVAVISRRQSPPSANVPDDDKMKELVSPDVTEASHSAMSTQLTYDEVNKFNFEQCVNTEFSDAANRSYWDCIQDIESLRSQQMSYICTRSPPPSESSSSFNDWATADSPVFIDESDATPPNIWCLDIWKGLIMAGCSNGTVELWDGVKGILKYTYKSNNTNGITCLKYGERRVVIGHADGFVDFLEVSCVPKVRSSDKVTSIQAKGHSRKISWHENYSWSVIDVQCTPLYSTKAHQSAVSLLDIAGGRCLTAAEDKMVKVFRLDVISYLFSLQGHNSPVTSLLADHTSPHIALSASEDGCIHLWDLITGACIHKLNGLSNAVLSLQCSSHYVVASSIDSFICIWDKSNGRLLHTIQRANCCQSGALAILADRLLVTGGKDTLYFWDLSSGNLVHSVSLYVTSVMDVINRVTILNKSTVLASVGSDIHSVQFMRLAEQKYD